MKSLTQTLENSENPTISDSPKVIGRINRKYILRELIGAFVIILIVAICTYGMMAIMYVAIASDGTTISPLYWSITNWIMIASTGIALILTYILGVLYYRNFKYEISDQYIRIYYGALTRSKATIPFSRIQNVVIFQSIRDRILHLYTIKIETAGFSVSPSHGSSRPEGYIPAIIDPAPIESMINHLVNLYTQELPEHVESQVFLDKNTSFDEFIAYILGKMAESNQIHTKITELRNEQNISQEDLANRLKLSVSTIKFLEEGKYVPSLILALRIARTLQVPIGQLFELPEI